MQRTCVLAAITVAMALGAVAVAGAFDGERDGFILGAGLGAGLTSFTQSAAYGGDSETSERESEFPLVTDFKIGYAPSDLIQIYWMSKVSWFSMENALAEDVTITSGVAGLGVTYFLQPTAPSAFVSGGIGYSTWGAPFEEGSDTWLGLGASLGAGYEFTQHWSVEGGLCWGNPSTDESGVDFTTNALSLGLSVNVIGY